MCHRNTIQKAICFLGKETCCPQGQKSAVERGGSDHLELDLKHGAKTVGKWFNLIEGTGGHGRRQ